MRVFLRNLFNLHWTLILLCQTSIDHLTSTSITEPNRSSDLLLPITVSAPPPASKIANQTTRLPPQTGPLNVSYVRQDCTPGLVISPVILYIRLPWFLMHSVLGEMLAIPSKTGCPSALTLRMQAEKIFHYAHVSHKPSTLAAHPSSPPTTSLPPSYLHYLSNSAEYTTKASGTQGECKEAFGFADNLH